MISPEVRHFFPHETIRKGQEELVADIEQTLKQKKILLAHAPTGLGKTASALSAAVEKALSSNKVVFFLTNRHTQHQIAVNTLKEIKKKTQANISCVDLIGKRHMCNQDIAGLFGNDFNEFCKAVVEKGECGYYNNIKTNKGISVEAQVIIKQIEKELPLHNGELISIGKEKNICSYEIALALAKKATVIISDYFYIFNPFIQATLFKKMEKELEDAIVIVDEGHNLANRVTDMISDNLTTNMISNAMNEAKKYHYSGLITWLDQLNKLLESLAKFEGFEKEKKISESSFTLQVKKILDYEQLIEELELAADEIRKKQRRSYIGGIASFLEAWTGDDQGYVRIIEKKTGKHGPFIALRYSCLDPSLITKEVFKKIDSGVIMSGTLTPTKMYQDILGIQDGICKEYSSPFPPENKLSLVIPETSTKFTLRNETMFQKIAQHCSQISTLIPGNVALFFPSYNLRDKVAYFFKSEKKLFFEKSDMNKQDKETLLNDFRSAKIEGGVLLGVTGANFAEGIDFPGDILNGVVVIGLPLARPDLKTKEVIAYYDQKFKKGWDYGYTFPAMSKCIQSAGRCIRSGTDIGTVIYLEERFSWERYYSCLPREGLIVTKDYQKYLAKFWEGA